jgi:sugar phosphate isomerase/epimerase
MQLGFVTAILPELPLEEVMSFAAAAGYDCVEVMCWPPSKADRRYAGVTHLDVVNFDQAAAEKIRGLIQKTGVQISSLGYYPNPLTPNSEDAAAAVAHLRKLISASALLGIGRATTFVGRDWTKSVDDNWPRFLETWRPLVQFAEEQKVRIGIENCPMLFSADEWPGGKNLATTPDIWRRMYADIPSSHFGLNFDPSHFVWQFMDYLPAMREFADRLVHVHAKDVRVDQQALNDHGIMANPSKYHIPKLPGLGDVLTDVGYRGPVCVEVEDRAYEDTIESRKASLVQSATYLRNFIPRR